MNLKKALVITSVSILSCFSTSAQVTVIDTLTVSELVNDYLLGGGVTATNITYNGLTGDSVYVQVGLFQGESGVIAFNEGIVMATSEAEPLVTSGGGFTTDNFQNDPDLVAISGQNINNAAIIEFDFIVQADSVKFNYVFSSTEYPGYTCSTFNDAFGFFMSGPGLNGPFENNAVNLALIPGTDIPVAINTVNSGEASFPGNEGLCEDANPNWEEDSQYFVENDPPAAGDVQIPGMTVTLTAQEAVQCAEEYHIKLAIGNAADQALQSAVFLEAGSFQAFGEIFANFSPVFGNGGAVSQPGFDSIPVAGCTNPVIELTRPSGSTFNTIVFEFQGNAEEGIDYILVDDPPSTFPQGVDTLLFEIETINPNIPDTLFLELLIIYESCAGVTDTTVLEIPIAPPPNISVTAENVEIFCPTDSVLIEAVAEGGLLPHIYNWVDVGMEEDGDAILVPLPADEQQYVIEVTDQCEFRYAYDTISVINSLPPALAGGIAPFQDPRCPNEPVDLDAVVTGGLGQYAYLWTDGSGEVYPGLSELTVEFVFTEDVLLSVTDECGTVVSDSVTVDVPVYDSLSVAFEPLLDNCPTEPLELSAEISGGAGDYEVFWSILEGEGSFVDGTGPTSNPAYFMPSPGENLVEGVVRDYCNLQGFVFSNCDEGQQFGFPYLPIACDTAYLPVIRLEPMQNVITPNDDGKNEVFVVEGINLFDEASVLIYDRWGRLIYENNSYDAGTGSATPSQGFSADGYEDGTYFYIVNVNNGECVQSGNLEVLGGSE